MTRRDTAIMWLMSSAIGTAAIDLSYRMAALVA